MQAVYRMPFGAEVLEAGQVKFQLWAPVARTVEIALEGGEARYLPMTACGDGRFAETVEVPADTQYRFRIDGEFLIPDPASRFQPQDVHGPSTVIDPAVWQWQDAAWHGRPWNEAVIYEVHVGSFTQAGTFAALTEHLDYLVDLGVTALELMPIADFPGARNWGYDGVLPYAPDSCYGHPHDLKALIQAAHARGLMVLLDVVYNHFGPEGNYLHRYAPQFFTRRHHTPWGDAINFDGENSRAVRDFFIHNAMYWIEEYRLDGLRLDAVHAIIDDSAPDILTELAERVRNGAGAQRHVHLILENDNNAAAFLARDGASPRAYTAQWNDDIHHALHILATREVHGYYMDYAANPIEHLGRCLSTGFAYQGEHSPYRQGNPRGEPSAHLPPAAFIAFLQNHDQIGNRAFGERIGLLTTPAALRAITAILLLAPSPPLLFMGQEWCADEPFLFFCDFEAELAGLVTEGRRREFASFPPFDDAQARATIPDPNALATFQRSVLDWNKLTKSEHAIWLDWHRHLLALRHIHIIPRLADLTVGAAHYEPLGERALRVVWPSNDGRQLVLLANLSDAKLTSVALPRGELIHAEQGAPPDSGLAPWSVHWYWTAQDP